MLAVFVLLLTLPALAQGSAAQESALTGLGAAVAALLIVWRRRCRVLPQYLPGDLRAELKPAPGRKAPPPSPLTERPPVPEETAVREPEPAPDLEFAPAPAPPEEDLVFETPIIPPGVVPMDVPVIDPARLESDLLELQGQFEAMAGELAAKLEAQWHRLVEFLEQARANLTGGVLPEEPAPMGPESLGPELVTHALLTDPPAELDGQGWSEPGEGGVRSRTLGEHGEFLGPLANPEAPAGAENPRAFYRERRVEQDGLAFREITRGVVAGRRLQILECARYPEHGLDSLLAVHRARAEAAGVPVGYRVFLTRSHSIRLFATLPQVHRLEPVLLGLPQVVRERLGDLLIAPDLGGRVDWEGRYAQDEAGRPATHAVLVGSGMLALRADLLTDGNLTRTALGHGLGHLLDAGRSQSSPWGEPPFVSARAAANAQEDFAETHRVLLEQWDDPVLEKVRRLKGELYP
ncbi:MAG: hypothetical protein AMXMBFR33_69050 [Candidatus Xenobia bacterium]